MNRRNFLKLGAAGLALPAIASAQGSKILNFIPQADLALLDPVQTTGLVTRNHGLMVFDTLYGLDDAFRPQPQMVAGHVVEENGRRWTLTLRNGLRFHDGTPVLARDAVASIQRWWNTDPFGQSLRDATEELSAPSDREIVFRLKQPFPLLPDALGKPSGICPIMPERLARTPQSTQVTEMVGSGPFRFLAAERVTGSRVVYEKFADYVPRPDGTSSYMAGPRIARVDRVVWHTLPDASTAAASLQSGEMDWWEQPIPDLLPVLRRQRNIKVEVKDTSGYLAMVRLNHLVPPFDNPAIRRALLGGIDQAEYMTVVMGEDRSLWTDKVGFFLPGTPLANDAGMAALTGPRDLGKVKRDLEAAGYRGERVVLVAPTDLPALNAMSELAGDMFRRVGINLDYQALDWGTVLQRLSSKSQLDQGGWSAFCNYIPGVIGINPATHSYLRGIGTRGTFGWPESERLETLRDAFLAAEGADEQQRLAREIQQQAFADVPYLPTGAYRQPTAYRSNITGILNGSPVFHNVAKG